MPDKVTTRTLQQMKAQGQRIVAVTAYDYPSAQLADAAGVDVILVGDSVGNTVLGYETTLPVRMETMQHHLQAVRRGVRRALLVVDMPFLSYGVSVEDAVYNAGALMQAGAEAVKVEGASPRVLDSIRAMVGVGIPVMAHLGLTPQSIHQFGGYRLQGRTASEQEALLQAAQAVQEAGAFSVVLEVIPASLAKRITESVQIPTIGIGAGVHCDGEIQVWHDILGLSAQTYKHTKRYAALREDYPERPAPVRRRGAPATVPHSRAKLRGGQVSLQELERIGAVLHGHFLLTSGRHSAVYFEKFRLLEQPALLERLVSAMLANLPREAVAEVQVVVGPTLGGVIVAYEAARQLGTRALYAEREGDGRAFRRGRVLEPATPALVVDDVLTTGTSIREVLALLKGYRTQVVGIGVLIDRSESPLAFGAPLASALRLPAQTYAPDECPLCQQGIPLTKRGSRGEFAPESPL
jgi:3-methyl-2-oxobutanoate hydroxymethyltransferase